MRAEDISRFYAMTPIWFWPVLWWSLYRLDRHMAERMAAGERGLARITTDGRGRLRVEWIARAEAQPIWRHNGPSVQDLTNLDAYARGFAAAAGGEMIRPGLREVTVAAPVHPPFAHLEPG